jgi:probable HAF family extracellular repeat protein
MLKYERWVSNAASRVVAVVLSCLPLLSSCGGSGDATPPSEIDPTQQSAGYVAKNLGTLAGDDQSVGFAVNNAGQVVGASANGSAGVRAFYWDGDLHHGLQSLTGADTWGVAYAISSGSPVYVGGFQETRAGRRAVVWTPATSTTPTVLEATDSFVKGLNDAGTAVGRYVDAHGAVHGAIWPLGGSRIDIPPLAGHVHAGAEDINNDGIVVGVAFGTDVDTDKAWVRLSNGELLELAGLPGSIGTVALALSDVVNGQFYIVGSTTSADGERRGVRWTFELATKSITPEQLGELYVATGVTNTGAVSGLSIPGGSAQPALVWRDGISLALGPTGAITSGRGIAGIGGRLYVVGEVFAAGAPVAFRWTVE